MCCDTKKKIAEGLLVVWEEKPLRKITVSDIMKQENMKRQSFYYHFQDVYDVIEWIFQENFAERVPYSEDEEFEEWVGRAIKVIHEDRAFYRKVLGALERERFIRMLTPVVKQQVEARFAAVRENVDPIAHQFVVRSMCHFVLDSLSNRNGASEEEIVQSVKNVTKILNLRKRERCM